MKYDIYMDTNSSEGFKIIGGFELKMMGKSQAKNNVKKTRNDEYSHLQARRDDDGVEDDQWWAPEMKNKQEQQMQALATTMMLSDFKWPRQRGGEVAVAYKPDPLTPVQGTNLV